MAKVLVVSDRDPQQEFLHETVRPVHIESLPSAQQFLQRLAWAIYDEADTPEEERVGAEVPHEPPHAMASR